MINRENEILLALLRIADAQEKLVSIAEEARQERLDMSNKLKARLQAGFTAKPEEQ